MIGNTIKLRAQPNAVGIKLANPHATGWNVTIRDNFVEKDQGIDGTIGILIAGPAMGLDVTGNEFNPRSRWTGANSHKISETMADEGPYGYLQRDVGDFSMPELSNGAVTLHKGELTQADVARAVLTIGPGTYFSMTARRATQVGQIARTTGCSAALIILNLKDGNVTLSPSGYLKLVGRAGFTGPGQIVFTMERMGGSDYAYEVSRTSL